MTSRFLRGEPILANINQLQIKIPHFMCVNLKACNETCWCDHKFGKELPILSTNHGFRKNEVYSNNCIHRHIKNKYTTKLLSKVKRRHEWIYVRSRISQDCIVFIYVFNKWLRHGWDMIWFNSRISFFF